MVKRVDSFFQKGGHSATQTELNVNKRKVKHHRNSDTKTGNREHNRTTALERSVMKYWGKGLKSILRAKHRPQFLEWYKTFSWLFGSHNNPLTRQ